MWLKPLYLGESKEYSLESLPFRLKEDFLTNCLGKRNILEQMKKINNNHVKPTKFLLEIMEQAADKMFSSTAEFLRTELNSTLDDFQLLQDMNEAVSHKYKNLTHTTQAIGGALEALEDQYRDLAPTLAQIDNIEESVDNLEQDVFKLEAFCKQLEQKLKSLETK